MRPKGVLSLDDTDRKYRDKFGFARQVGRKRALLNSGELDIVYKQQGQKT